MEMQGRGQGSIETQRAFQLSVCRAEFPLIFSIFLHLVQCEFVAALPIVCHMAGALPATSINS